MNIVINPKYGRLRSFIENIPTHFEVSGETIYDERNQLKTYQVEGLDVVVKRFRKPNLLNKVAYTNLRLSKAKRSFEYSFQLLEKGINTPEPIAYIEEKKNGLLGYSYYICIYEREFNHIRDQMMGRNIPIGFIQDLSIFIAQMHNNGILHQDLSPGNILFKTIGTQTLFTAVDINRMKFVKEITNDMRFKNFRRLTKNSLVINEIADEYASYCLLDVEKTKMAIHKYCADFKLS